MWEGKKRGERESGGESIQEKECGRGRKEVRERVGEKVYRRWRKPEGKEKCEKERSRQRERERGREREREREEEEECRKEKRKPKKVKKKMERVKIKKEWQK